VAAAPPSPIGEGGGADDDRAKQQTAQGCADHDLPAGLAVPDDNWLAFRLGTGGDHVLKEGSLGMDHVRDRLAGASLGSELRK
jgi:hypothetical protein